MNDLFRTFTCRFLPIMRSKLQRHFQSCNLKSSQIFHINAKFSYSGAENVYIVETHYLLIKVLV